MAKKKSENYLDFIPIINSKNDWSEGEDGIVTIHMVHRGFYATIAAIKDDVITISFGPDSTKAMIARWAVRSLEDTPADAQNDLI